MYSFKGGGKEENFGKKCCAKVNIVKREGVEEFPSARQVRVFLEVATCNGITTSDQRLVGLGWRQCRPRHDQQIPSSKSSSSSSSSSTRKRRCRIRKMGLVMLGSGRWLFFFPHFSIWQFVTNSFVQQRSIAFNSRPVPVLPILRPGAILRQSMPVSFVFYCGTKDFMASSE